MECKKLAFLFVAVAVVLLAKLTPTAFAARSEVALSSDTNAVANIRNPFANILLVKRSPENCIPSGGFCGVDWMGCCGNCGCLVGFCYGTSC